MKKAQTCLSKDPIEIEPQEPVARVFSKNRPIFSRITRIKVVANYMGKLATGRDSMVSAEASLDIPEGMDLEEALAAHQQSFLNICRTSWRHLNDEERLEKLKMDFRRFRFYLCPTCGLEHPSVTTVNDPNYESWVSKDVLDLAIAEGNIAHARAAYHIQTGVWLAVKDLEKIISIGKDLILCRGRFLDNWSFPAMLEKYPIKNMENGYPLFNCRERYAGTPDFWGMYPLGGILGNALVPTIFDFKRSADQEKNFAQMAGYAAATPERKIQQMAIITTKGETAQGFSRPIVSTAVESYTNVFINRRRQFEKEYGV